MIKQFTRLLCILSLSLSSVFSAEQADVQKPLLKDFLGINGHYTFKPELYIQTCKLVRNYHNINWDVKQLGDPITVPVCQNKVNWNNVYGPWKKHGYEIDICLQFSGFGHKMPKHGKEWEQHLDWAQQYAGAIAEYFGPSGNQQLCTSIEIGNEPGQRFDHEAYVKVYKHMAQGIRAADKNVKIVTATTHAQEADDYSFDLRKTYASKEMIELYDVINIHTYASLGKTPDHKSPWNRSYPEDQRLNYLKVIDETIAWRNKHAPGKEIWVTEFGYDCVSEDAMKNRKDWFKKLDWQGCTDQQQAQYIIRSIFAFMKRDVDRAYIYFYDDKNAPSVHAGAGLTRNFKPKPSFWAVKQCYELLGDYRFDRIIEESKQAFVYAFKHESHNKEIWVAWSPSGVETHKKDGYVGKSATVKLKNLPGTILQVISMAENKSNAETLPFTKKGSGINLVISESPCYIMFE